MISCGFLLASCSGHKPPALAAPAPAVQATAAPAPDTDHTDLLLRQIAAQPDKPLPGAGWKVLLNPESMEGWKPTDFAGGGEVETGHGILLLNMGDPFTGVNRTDTPLPAAYEIAFDAMRVSGTDFFCGLTIPVAASHCSLILGGWGGSLVGISSLNGMDASENETTTFKEFASRRWYAIRLRVTEKRIQVWIDEEPMIKVDLADQRVSLRFGEIERSKPLGFASWQTSAAFRNIRYRAVDN
jgi:hypothetical protein